MIWASRPLSLSLSLSVYPLNGGAELQSVDAKPAEAFNETTPT